MTTQGLRRIRSVCAVLAATVVAGGLAACSSSPPTPTPQPAPATTSTTSSSGGSTSTSRSTSGSSTTPVEATGRCTINTAKAVVEQAPGGASAGHLGLQVTVTNASSAPCVIQGFPGVSLVTGTQGQELGAPAKRTTANPVQVTLPPGAKASAPLQLAEASNFPDCGVTAAMGFRIYLPDDTAAQFSQQTQQGCSNTAVTLMEIGPFTR